MEEINKTKFDGIYLVATNPLDVMTYITWKYSGLPANQVLGSGTSLDTARLRYLIGEKINVNPKNVHAYVVGEHGDSEFVPWSNATIGLQNIKDFIAENELKDISEEVRNAAYEIIERKGNTSYGIGVCLVRITNAILGDENIIISVSAYDKENDVYVSTPTIINKKGVREKIFINLNEEETRKMDESIKVIKTAINSIE